MSIFIVLYSLALPSVYARQFVAKSIKQGIRAEVDARYTSSEGSAGQVTLQGVELIGATGRAAFFYDPDAKRTIVIPQAQLVSIEVPNQP
jgi:hypothetical protein